MQLPLYAGNQHHAVAVIDRKTMFDVWTMDSHTAVDKCEYDDQILRVAMIGLKPITEQEFNARYGNALSTLNAGLEQPVLKPF